jgi:HD-GYP domain-containing protein (c-di-GMP phosphodiesterase class II)
MSPAAADRRDVCATMVEVLRGNLRNRRPETVAHDPAVGQRAAEVLQEAIEAVAASNAATEMLRRFGLRPGFLGPSVDTALMVAMIGVRRGWEATRLVHATISGFFADIGMLRLPEEAVFKPCALNTEEVRVMRLHPYVGSMLLEPLTVLAPQICEVALQHHEHVDGSGYPNGLRAGDILEEAQAVGICHLYSAATHVHPHRETLTPAQAMDLVEGLAGRAWDPRVVRAFADGLAMYPVGTLVRLANGESGVVVAGGTPRRPLVEMRWSAEGIAIHERLVPASTTDSGLAIVAVGRP